METIANPMNAPTHTFRVLGGCLRADLDFPELPAAKPGSVASWTFATQSGPAPQAQTSRLGEDSCRDFGPVTLDRTPHGYRLTYLDTGTYDILQNGSQIHWYPPQNQPYPVDQFFEAVRIDVIGRVLATAMHAAGIESLHGSSVQVEDGTAIAFVAPKFHGKSTLATALVGKGARLVTDDTLPVELGRPVMAHPGVHQLRMWEDTASELGADLNGLEVGSWGKFQCHQITEEHLVHSPIPLAAVYLLAPRFPEDGVSIAAKRDHISGMEAALSLVAQAKIGPLLGASEAVSILAWASQLAQAVPVYRLEVMRDFTRLPDVASQLLKWHASPQLQAAESTLIA